MFESNAFERRKRNTQKPFQGKRFRPLESTRFKDLWFAMAEMFRNTPVCCYPQCFSFLCFFFYRVVLNFKYKLCFTHVHDVLGQDLLVD